MKNDELTETASTPAAIVPLGQDPEMISDFVLEAHEHLQSIEAHVLRLEKDASDQEAIHAIFRAFHTIKGLAGFLDLGAIRELSHEVETVLDKARENELQISGRLIDVVLESADYLKRALGSLEAGLHGGPPVDPGENGELLARVRGLLTAAAEPVVEAAAMVEPSETLLHLASSVAAKPTERVREVVAQPGRAAAPARQSDSRSVKVDTGKLDHLVDTVGEMVIAQSMIQHDPELGSINRPRLVRNLAQLARITNEVQKTAMSMRMVPVGQLFQRMSRLVRDLTRKTGKKAELELVGEDTELDRNLVEELADPLMHMLRNSVDHGVETPERRAERGKPPVARLRLRASHESGNIVVEVSDDGNGLDRTKILARAVKNGLVSDPDNISDSELFNLIFHPGFSTAEQVTDVSGRGVGMDVVRRQVQKLRGRVEIHSTTGQGTTFLLKLPLTLAIVDGLIIGVGAERYIMPLFAVREMLRPTAETLFTVQDKGEMALVRERLLPVVRLYRRFSVRPKTQEATESLLIVAESSTRPFAILVDELIGKQEVVIKSLGPMLHDVPGIAGGAILGDGRVGLILDLDRVFEPEPNHEHARTEG
jgi:two-component system chemotaxis sensor kinase CheA